MVSNKNLALHWVALHFTLRPAMIYCLNRTLC